MIAALKRSHFQSSLGGVYMRAEIRTDFTFCWRKTEAVSHERSFVRAAELFLMWVWDAGHIDFRSNFSILEENKSIKSAVIKSCRGFLCFWFQSFLRRRSSPLTCSHRLARSSGDLPSSQVIVRHSVKANNLLRPRPPCQIGRCNNNSFISGLFLESKVSWEGHGALSLSLSPFKLFNFRRVRGNQSFWIIKERCGRKENQNSK